MEREITRDRKPPMTINGALLMLFSWLATAAFICFVAAVAGDVNAWLAKNQHLSGWVQGIGAGAAVIAAWLLTRRQIAAAMAGERERDRLHRLRHLQAAHLVFSALLVEAESMRRADPRNFPGREAIQRSCRTSATELDSLVLHELPPVVAWQASTARGFLVQIDGLVSDREKLAGVDEAVLRSATVVLRRVATRGSNLAWTFVARTATPQELAEERAMRKELDRLHEEVDSAIPFSDP